jgi:hypothetical protein
MAICAMSGVPACFFREYHQSPSTAVWSGFVRSTLTEFDISVPRIDIDPDYS